MDHHLIILLIKHSACLLEKLVAISYFIYGDNQDRKSIKKS